MTLEALEEIWLWGGTGGERSSAAIALELARSGSRAVGEAGHFALLRRLQRPQAGGASAPESG